MSLSLAGMSAFALSPRPRQRPAAPSSPLAAALHPARIQLWVSADGHGRLRDLGSGDVHRGPMDRVPERPTPWRIERLDDHSGFGRHFQVHDPETAPLFVPREPVLGGRPAIRTVDAPTSGFILRFAWRVTRPLAMFAVVEGSGSNRVLSESVDRLDTPFPDLGNIIDFATSTSATRPVPAAFQNGNGTLGTTPLLPGRAYLVAAIYDRSETFVRVDGRLEGYEAGVTNGVVADSLSLLNNPTVRHGDNRWAGALGEYLFIAGSLDGPRIRAIERHLATRWGLALEG